MDNELFYIMEREWFRDTVWIPFEHLFLPACGEYEKHLTAEYGEWQEAKRGDGLHGYPAYGSQEAHMRKKTGKNMFRYTYNEADLHAARPASLQQQAADVISLLAKAQEQAEALLASGDVSLFRQMVTSCQQLAVQTGELLEAALIPDKEAVQRLEIYCEQAFLCYETPDANTLQGMKGAFAQVQRRIEAALQARCEVVFIAVKPEWWKTMEPEYRKALQSGASVHVIPIPWYERDAITGVIGAGHDERAGFPQDVPLTMPEMYSLAGRHPDRIVIQFPYDTLYRAIVLDPMYYAASLRKLTPQLTYIPCYSPDTPGKSDLVARKTLRYLIEQPAVVLADRVVLPDEGMRQLYIDVMSEIAGEDTRDIWKKKMETG